MRIQHWIYTIPLRLRSLVRRNRVEQELHEELQYHLERKTEEFFAQGMTRDDARRAALRAMDGLELRKEECRDARGVTFLETLFQDVHFGLRTLRKSPGFVTVAVLTLTLGIGANTAIFSVVNSVLLRPLPYSDPARLVWATEHFAFGPTTVVSADFPTWKDGSHVFDQIGAFGGTAGANLTGRGEPIRVTVTNVTTGFFSMLGVQPIVGRLFSPEEGKQGQEHVALVNETLWRNRFGADTRIMGETVQLDGSGYTVVGVMPASLRYPQADVWTPLALDSEIFSPHSPRWMMLTAIGRLKPGTEIGQAQSDLQLLTKTMDKEYPPQAARFRGQERVEVIPLHELLVHNVRSLLMILLGATGFVLLIACGNVANLLLSRGIGRGHEVAIRAALGAGRVRLIQQLLTESLLLLLAGAFLGSLAGFWATRILKQLIPASLPIDVPLEPRIFAFSAFISSAALLIFGLVPALIASRTNVNEILQGGRIAFGGRYRTHRLRGTLVAGEVALSLILLVGAGLLSRSFLHLTEVHLGFDPQGVLAATVERPLTALAFDSQQHAAFFRDSLERIRNLPVVKEVALTQRYPLGPLRNATLMLHVEGAEDFRPSQPVSVTAIGPEYFHVMRVGLLNGRTFSKTDVAGSHLVVILNERLAQMIFRGRNPLGQQIGYGPRPAPWCEIVGIVANMRQDALEREPAPELFVPYTQQATFAMTFMVRTDSNFEMVAGAVRGAIASVDKNQPVSEIVAMDDVLANSVAPRRFRTLLLGLFASLALVLAVIGIYGVMAYSCNQRIYEFGIRVALGARRADIVKLVLRQGFILTLIGLAIGVSGALGLTRYLSSFLYGVKPDDPLTFVLVSAILATAVLLASGIPARRAMRIDPMVALRQE
jgi:predicted permease